MLRINRVFYLALCLLTVIVLTGSFRDTDPAFRASAHSATPVVLAPDPVGAESIAFFAFGDWGAGNEAQRRVARALERVAARDRDVHFTLLLGDNFYGAGVDSTGDSLWRSRFESIYSGPHLLGMPFYAVLGNHDHEGNAAAQIAYAREGEGSARWRMPADFYVKDFGRDGLRPLVRLVAIDTHADGRLSASQQAAVLAAFSAGSADPRWKIVAGHMPVRSVGGHGENVHLIERLLPVLRKARVDVYLSGHEHNQQVLAHPGEPLYVISGGGGKRLYEIERRNGSVRHAAAEHGFVKVSAEQSTLTFEFFNEAAERTHASVLRRPCPGSMSDCLQAGPGPTLGSSRPPAAPVSDPLTGAKRGLLSSAGKPSPPIAPAR